MTPFGRFASKAATSASLLAADRLDDELLRLADNAGGHYAVHFELPSAVGAAVDVSQTQLALRPIEHLAALHEAKLFCLADGHVLLVCHGKIPIDQVDGVIGKVRSSCLTAVAGWEWDGAEQADADWFDLSQPEDVERLRSLTAAWKAKTRRQGLAPAAAVRGASPSRSLNAEELAAICQRLELADLTAVVRQQTALTLRCDAAPAPLLRETYISMHDLRALIAPGVDMAASNWLFRYLTEILDRRMLDFVTGQRLACGPVPISLNLNLASLTTSVFNRFLDIHGKNVAKPILEIQLVDLLAHGAVLAKMRQSFEAQGYKILIDGFTPPTLQALDVSAVRPDFVKIWWREDAPTMFPDPSVSGLRETLERIGTDSIILARAESEQAVRWGVGHGIRRFQGRFIDRLVGALADKCARGRGSGEH